MDKNNKKSVLKITRGKSIQEKEVDIMPSIEMMQQTRVSYIDDMKKYVDNLKSMPKEKAVRLSKKNLISSGIIDKNCNLTDRYAYSKSSKR